MTSFRHYVITIFGTLCLALCPLALQAQTTKMEARYTALAERFPDKPVMIVEAAYYYLHDGVNRGEEDFTHCPPGTVEGQRQFTADLVAELNRHNNVTGLFWWYPEENRYGTRFEKSAWGLNRGLFNSVNGQALPALYEMSRFKQ